MGIRTIIEDGTGSNGSAAVIARKDVKSGLVAYTEPYRQVIAKTAAMTNTLYGVDMAKNGGFSGTPDVIHNGTDTVVWTGTNLVGANFVFDSTAQAQAGTKSIDATATVSNDEALLTRGSAISSGSYAAMSGYVYLTNWTSTSNVQLVVRNAGTVVSSTLNLSGYINGGVLNAWQRFVIPIVDFAMGTVNFDQVVIRTIGTGSNTPNYYLDTLQWEQTGSGLTYLVEPPRGTIYTITDMSITMADAYVSTLADASHPKIPYNTLLGVSKLPTGIQFRLTTDDLIRFSGFFQQHLDFMAFPGLSSESGGDGTNTWITYHIKFDTPFVMDARTLDKFEAIITDDLSGLLFLKVFVRGHYEEII